MLAPNDWDWTPLLSKAIISHSLDSKGHSSVTKFDWCLNGLEIRRNLVGVDYNQIIVNVTETLSETTTSWDEKKKTTKEASYLVPANPLTHNSKHLYLLNIWHLQARQFLTLLWLKLNWSVFSLCRGSPFTVLLIFIGILQKKKNPRVFCILIGCKSLSINTLHAVSTLQNLYSLLNLNKS